MSKNIRSDQWKDFNISEKNIAMIRRFNLNLQINTSFYLVFIRESSLRIYYSRALAIADRSLSALKGLTIKSLMPELIASIISCCWPRAEHTIIFACG